MKAAVLYEPLKLEVREDIEIPKLRKKEVLIKVRSVGVCPNDVRYYVGEGHHWHIPYGENSYGLQGHEYSGEVVEIGDEVEGISPGDYVSINPIVPCGECRYCRMGFTNVCVKKTLYLRAYAEYAVGYAPNACKFPKHIDFEEASFAEPLACVLNAAKIASIQPGDVMLVVGAGPMGLLHTMLAKMVGATVVVSEIIPERLQNAQNFGADYAHTPATDELSKTVSQLTDGVGADVVMVSIGNPAAIEQHIKYVRKRGTVIIFGGIVPAKNISVDPNQIHYYEYRLTGSSDYTAEEFRRAVNIISRRKLDVRKLISHRFQLDQVALAFETSLSKKGLKVVVKP